MKFSKYAFPHPILGPGDDIDGNATAVITIDETSDEFEFRFHPKFKIENPDIESLIASGSAEYYCEVTCSATLFRNVFTSESPEFEFQVPKNFLRGTVDLLFLVVATKEIPSYANSAAHPEFTGLLSDLEKGDVLACPGTTRFLADVSFKKLKAASTFLEVVEGSFDSGPFKVILQNPKILIQLSRADYAKYTVPAIGRSVELASTFQSSIAFPALLCALHQLNGPDAEFLSEQPWAQALQWRLENDRELAGKPLESENIPEIAQLILGSPVERLLDDLKRTFHLPDEEEI